MTNPFALPLPSNYKDLPSDELDAFIARNNRTSEVLYAKHKPYVGIGLGFYILAITVSFMLPMWVWSASLLGEIIFISTGLSYIARATRCHTANIRMLDVNITRIRQEIEKIEQEL